MTADPGSPAQSPKHTSLVLILLLAAVSLNLLYPGEVFPQSRYFFILSAQLACAFTLWRDHKTNVSVAMLRHLILAFLPLIGLAASLVWTTNQNRSQEVFLLFFSYSCLLFSLWRCRLRMGTLLASLLTLVTVSVVVEVYALYQHFAGFEALKLDLTQRSTMDPDFRAALLARIESGRIFANFSLPNTLAGLVTMILPLQGALLCGSFSCSSLKQLSPAWIQFLRNRSVRVVLAAGLLLSFCVLALTQSFGGWVALLVSTAAALFIGLYRTGRRAPWILSCCLLLLLACLWLAWVSHKRGFHLWSLTAAENPISLRVIAYRTAWLIFQDFPITGVGLGNYGALNPRYQVSPRFVTQFAHNTPLQLLSEGGLVFLAGVLTLIGAAVRMKSSRNSFRGSAVSKDPMALGMMGSLIAWCVHNGLDIDLYFPSLGALGFLLVGLLSNYLTQNVDGKEDAGPWAGKVLTVAIEIALTFAVLAGVRAELSRSYLDLAGISARSGNLDEACHYARWALKLKPKDASGVVFLGKLETQRLKQNGQPVSVLLQTLTQSMKEAVRLDPYNPEFRFELGRLYKGLGEEKLSAENLAAAVDLFPSEPKYRRSTTNER